MSISNFFKSGEDAAVKVMTFIVKEMTFAEEVLGAGTGSAKANIVISAVKSALQAMGVPIDTVETELKDVLEAVTKLFNKTGVFNKPAAPTP